MAFLLLLPVILSFLLLGAHVLRHFDLVYALLALAPIIVLLIPRRAAALTVQVLLLLAALEWVRALAALIEMRQARGEDWLRAAFIIGGVTLFTLLSMLVFHTRRLRRYYRATPMTTLNEESSDKFDG